MGYRFSHMHLKTPDPRKTAEWYVEYMGAKIVSDNEGRSFRLDLHGVSVNVTNIIADQPIDQFMGLEHIAIDTDDFDAQVARIKASGTKVLLERVQGNGRVCFFEGPEGVRLEFIERREG